MSLKILIVEDESRISHLLSLYLKKESFHVDVENNGDDGLTKALQVDYDVIILDVFMPGKDGFMVLEGIRQHKNTPVIMLSAQSGEYDQRKGYDLGANAFISKPFSPSEVVAKVKGILA